MANKTIPSCPVCRSDQLVDLLQMTDIPIVCNNLHLSKNSALEATCGDFHLTFCKHCGHCFNPGFNEDTMDYGANYETSLHFSPKFQDYASHLSRRLIETYGLHHKVIIEMGCGQGEFLSEICERGNNKGIGFDQSFDRTQADLPDFVRVYDRNFGTEFSDVKADLICCRHVLEHVADPHAFLRMVRTGYQFNRDGIVYFEVPNGLFTLRDLGIWDLIYEHCAYFWEGSIRRLFEDCGFTVLRTETTYDDQFLSIEARVNSAPNKISDTVYECTSELNQLSDYAQNFASKFLNKQKHWRDVRRTLSAEHKTSVVWGAGSKGITFLNLTRPSNRAADRLLFAVDISPRKHGKFVPGTGQEIVPPEALIDINPDVVFLMNSTYTEEIRSQLADMGLNPRVEIV